MKKYAMTACLFMAALNVCAQTKEKDSLRVIDLQEVEIISTRATGTTPVAFTNINKEQLKKQNFGQDLPYLLSMTPSAITTSDAGAGIGYTTLRVRGTDGTRIKDVYKRQRVDHLVSRLPLPTIRPVQTRFRFGSGSEILNLAGKSNS